MPIGGEETISSPYGLIFCSGVCVESLYLLIPVALVFVAIAIKVFFWAVNNGQYDDLDTEAHRILFDDDRKLKTKSSGTRNGAKANTENDKKSDGE